MTGYIDTKKLSFDELVGIVNMYPWFGGARKELCLRMLQMGSGSDEQFAAAAMYLPSRKVLADIVRRAGTEDLSDADVEKLISVLQQLTDTGNTVIVIEHNLDVIKVADWLIDLGPEGGDGGGTIVCAGTPETVAECEGSYTGQFLKTLLSQK